MEQQSKKEDKTDISRNIEELLLGVFLLFGKVITTFYYFMLKPHQFSEAVLNYDPLNDTYPKKYSRPITYYFVALALFIGGFILIFKIVPQAEELQRDNPFLAFVSNAFKEVDLSKLITGLLPFIFAVGLYSFCFFWINKKKFPQLKFRNSLYLSSYFTGSVLLIYVLIIPLYPLMLTTGHNPSLISQIGLWTLAIFGWSALFRALYSYLVLLKYLGKSNRLGIIRAFMKGFFFFLLIYSLILTWLSPLAFALMEDIGK